MPSVPVGAGNDREPRPFGEQEAVVAIDVWTKIVWAAKDSDDYRLRTLIEQAVAGCKIRPVSS